MAAMVYHEASSISGYVVFVLLAVVVVGTFVMLQLRLAPKMDVRDDELGKVALTCLMATKLVASVNLNFVYPYAPYLAPYLGVSLFKYGQLLVAQELGSLAYALFAPLLDSQSSSAIRRRLFLGQISIATSTIALPLLPSGSFFGYLVLRFAFGISYAVVAADTAALVGDNVSEQRQGWAMSFVEGSWPLADVMQCGLGVLLEGCATLGLAPVSPAGIFFAVGLLSIPCSAMVVVVPHKEDVSWECPPCCAGYGKLMRSRKPGCYLGWLLLICIVYNVFHAAYGEWLKDTYDARQADIGMIFFCTASAELSANLIAALFISRLTASGAQLAAHGAWSVTVVVLSFAGSFSFAGAAALTFAIYISAELSYVVSWTLASELAEGDQLTMFAAYGAVQGVGRMLGAGLAHKIWAAGGLPLISQTSMGAMAAAGAFLVLAVSGKRRLNSIAQTPMLDSR